jgi:hypothetical protein
MLCCVSSAAAMRKSGNQPVRIMRYAALVGLLDAQEATLAAEVTVFASSLMPLACA